MLPLILPSVRSPNLASLASRNTERWQQQRHERLNRRRLNRTCARLADRQKCHRTGANRSILTAYSACHECLLVNVIVRRGLYRDSSHLPASNLNERAGPLTRREKPPVALWPRPHASHAKALDIVPVRIAGVRCRRRRVEGNVCRHVGQPCEMLHYSSGLLLPDIPRNLDKGERYLPGVVVFRKEHRIKIDHRQRFGVARRQESADRRCTVPSAIGSVASFVLFESHGRLPRKRRGATQPSAKPSSNVAVSLSLSRNGKVDCRRGRSGLLPSEQPAPECASLAA